MFHNRSHLKGDILEPVYGSTVWDGESGRLSVTGAVTAGTWWVRLMENRAEAQYHGLDGQRVIGIELKHSSQLKR